MHKLLFVTILMLGSTKLMGETTQAETAPIDNVEIEANAITEDQVRASIGLLLRAGVLEFNLGRLQVKEQSALDVLRQSGRVKSGDAMLSQVCFRSQ